MKKLNGEQKIRVAGYCRVSTPGQVDRISLDDQKKRIEEYCNNNGWHLVSMYVDEGISGGTDNRTEFCRMLADAAQGKFNILVVVDNSRFGRNIEDRIRIRKTLVRDFGLKLYSLKEGEFKDDPTGRLQDNIIASTNEWQKDILKEKSMSALRYKLEEKGEMNLGQPLYGYEWGVDKKTYVPHRKEASGAPEAPNVRLVVDLRIKLKATYTWIADFLNGKVKNAKAEYLAKLNEVKLPTNYRGHLWDRYKVGYIFKNPKYYLCESSVRFAGVKYSFVFEPLMAKYEFDQCQKILGRNFYKGTKHPILLGDGKIKCGICGSSLHHNTICNNRNGKRYEYFYYVCRNKLEKRMEKRCRLQSIPQDWIEEQVWDELQTFFAGQERFEQVILKAECKLAEDGEQLDKIANKLVKIEKALEDIKAQCGRIVRQVRIGTFSDDDVAKQMAKLHNAKAKLQEERDELQKEESMLCRQGLIMEKLKKSRMWWYSYTQKLSFDQKKEIIDMLVDKIVVWPCKLAPDEDYRTPKISFDIIGKVPLMDDTFYRSSKKGEGSSAIDKFFFAIIHALSKEFNFSKSLCS